MQVTYQVTIRNDGTAASERMTLADTATVDSVPIRCQTNSTTFVCGWYLGSLDPGEVVTREFRFLVPNNTVGQTLRNTASVDLPGVAEAVVEHVVRQRSLEITKELISPQPADPNGTAVIQAGSTAVYRVTVTNNGTAVATNVELNDQPFVSQGITASPLTNQRFTLGDIQPGQTVIVEPINVPVSAAFAGRILANVASVEHSQRADRADLQPDRRTRSC